MNNLYPANPFYYSLLSRHQRIDRLNRTPRYRTQESVKQRFYNIAQSRIRIKPIYPRTILNHAMYPYKYIEPQGKIKPLERVKPIYLYRKDYSKNEWLQTKRFFSFQKTKYYVSLKEFRFCLIDGGKNTNEK